MLVGEIESLEGLEILAERLIEMMSDTFEIKAGEAVIGVSIGIAVFGGSKAVREDPEQVVHRADEAMYQAKQAGRNRVVIAPSPV